MREKRDVDRLDSRLVPLVAPFPLVSHVSRANIVFSQPTRRELPGPEGTAIEMDELRARIKPYPTVLQPQRGTANLAQLDTGNIEVERLPLDM